MVKRAKTLKILWGFSGRGDQSRRRAILILLNCLKHWTPGIFEYDKRVWFLAESLHMIMDKLGAWVTSPGPYPIPEYREDGLTPNVPLTLFHHYITFPPTTILTTTLIWDDDQMSYFLVLFLTGGPAAGGLLLTGGLSSPPPWLNAWARTTPTSPPSPWRPFSSWKYHHVIIWWM